MLKMSVRGIPAPKGSLKCVGGRGGSPHTLVPNNAKTLKPWTERLVEAAKRGAQTLGGPYGGPVGVQAVFYLPKGPTVRRWAPWARGADLDKLDRALLDALQTGGVLTDDAQVVDLWTSKRYADHDHPAGVTIQVWPVDADPC